METLVIAIQAFISQYYSLIVEG